MKPADIMELETIRPPDRQLSGVSFWRCAWCEDLYAAYEMTVNDNPDDGREIVCLDCLEVAAMEEDACRVLDKG